MESYYISVESNRPPWTPKKLSQPPYPPKAMVILLPLKTSLGIDSRSISAYLRAFPEQRIKIGLGNPPTHTTIRNHMLRLPEAYLRRLNTQLTKPYQKGGSPRTARATASTDPKHGFPLKGSGSTKKNAILLIDYHG